MTGQYLTTECIGLMRTVTSVIWKENLKCFSIIIKQVSIRTSYKIKMEYSTFSLKRKVLMYDCYRDQNYQNCKSEDLMNYHYVQNTETSGKFTPRHGTVIQSTNKE